MNPKRIPSKIKKALQTIRSQGLKKEPSPAVIVAWGGIEPPSAHQRI